MVDFEETNVIPKLLCTAVGSLPHTDPDVAVDLILNNLPTAPHTPQLSRAYPQELMWVQVSEGLPRFQADYEQQSYHFDTSGDAAGEIEQFYTDFLTATEGPSTQAFAISRDYGRGIYVLLDRLKNQNAKFPFIKVQVSGPLSFAMTVTDEVRKPIFYHSTFRDVAVKGMGLKAIWLLEQFEPFAEKVIVFFDEPSLSAYGSSAFLGVSKTDVVESLDEVINMVLDKGGIPGIHCCGNTDWGMIMETSTRIISFDAIDYTESLALYNQQLSQFLGRGGVLAWGAVPNTEKIEKETRSDIIRRLQSGFGILEKSGIDTGLLNNHIIVTPACGCAGVPPEQAEKTYKLLAEIEEIGLEAV
jgi:hypothetical protein